MNNIKFPINSPKQINSSKGRVYQTQSGATYPSVTTIVSIINAKFIAQWRAKVGNEKANAVCAAASGNGTKWHSLCEQYLTEQRQLLPTTDNFAAVSDNWLNNIYPHISNIRGVEYCTWSDQLKAAGTIDLVSDWDNKLAIIDWKTTSHFKKAEDVTSYWCQLAAYAYMVKERFNLIPSKLVLVFNESNERIYFYEQPVRKWLEKFIEIRKQYQQHTGI